MTSLTLSIPKEIRKKMDEHPEINWSEVARQSIIQKILLLEKLNQLFKDSKLTKKETVLLGRKISRGVAKRILKA